MKLIRRALVALILIPTVGLACQPVGPANATANQQVCGPLSSGKIDVSDPPTVSVTAPDGYLISGYCVKAGSTHNGYGPVYVTVDPAAKTVLIDYPDKDSISHYSYSLVKEPESSTTTTTTTSTIPGPPDGTSTTTIPPTVTTTTPVPSSTPSTVTPTAPTTPPDSSQPTTTECSTGVVVDGVCQPVAPEPTPTVAVGEPPVPPQSQRLPATGNGSNWAMLGIGVGLVGLGSALAASARRKVKP